MLKRLRRQFVLITVALTGAVLIAVLGTTLWSSWHTNQDILEQALERALNDDLDKLPRMGNSFKPVNANDKGRQSNMLALAVDVSETGVIIKSSKAPVVINSSVLADVVSEALASDSEEGSIPDLHVTWKRRFTYTTQEEDTEYGDYLESYESTPYARVVIVDTSAIDEAFDRQIRNSILITLLALVALFAVSWVLSSIALKPVSLAWEQQRRFVADASHELKTPLAVILANTEILAKDPGLNEDERRWVDSTLEEATHMRGLVTELLELARTDESLSGTSTVMHKEDVDLSELVDGAALEFDAVAFEHGCLIETDIEPDIHMQGDREWLTRLAKILVDNACKYAEPSTSISVTLHRQRGKAVLTVHNQGNPIDPEDLPHLFERFYRSDKARTRGTGGFGLGLAIAKGVVDTHGGTIEATSTQADGTTFTVTL